MKTPYSPAEYRLLIPAKKNRACGVPNPHCKQGSMERLKLEVDVAVARFWKKRGMEEPQSGFHFKLHLGKGLA